MHDPASSISSQTIEALLSERDWVRRLARSLAADVHRADDIAQSTWVAALEHPPHHARNLRSWLSTLVRNTARTMARSDARRARREADVDHEREVEEPDRALERAELVGRLVNVVLALREPYRSVLVLCYFEGLSPGEIAERTAVPSSSVRNQIKRGLELVRSELERQGRGAREDWLPALLVLAREPLRGAPPVRLQPASVLSPGFLILMKSKIAIAAVCLIGLSVLLWTSRRHEPRALEVASDPAAMAAPLAAGPRPNAIEPSAREAVTPSPSSAVVAAPSTTEGSLRVEVVWKKDDSPAAGVGVLVNRSDGFGREISHEGVTDQRGVFVDDHLEPGTGIVFADRGGSERFKIEGSSQNRVRIAIPPGLHVRGWVTDPASKPVEGAAVELSYQPQAGAGHVVARSGSDGSFEIDSVEPHHHVGARHDGWAPSHAQELYGTESGTVDVTLVLLGPGGSARGLVLGPDAQPIEYAQVLVGMVRPNSVELPGRARGTVAPALQTCTDAQGRFKADGLALGENAVMVAARGFARQGATVNVRAGEEAGVEIHLGKGATLHGVVHDAEGFAVPHVKVEIDTYGNAPFARTRTDAAGAYRIERVSSGEHPVLADGESHGRLRGTIEARDGEELVWNPTLERGLVLAGRVIDENGAGLAGWWVSTQPAKNQFKDDEFQALMQWPDSWGRTRTDAEGRFMLCNLLAMESTLDVRRPGQPGSHPLVVLEDVKPGTQDLLICVRPEDEPSAFVHGVVVDASGAPVGDAELTLLRVPMYSYTSGSYGKSDHETGAFKIGPLPAGRYRLDVHARGFVQPYITEQDLHPNDDFDFGTIRLESAGAVCVTLKRAGGGPIGKVDLWVHDDMEHQVHLLLLGDRARSETLAPGSYHLVVNGPDAKRIGDWVPFEIVSRKETDLEFVLPPEPR